jgi:hypothetical protein
MTFLNDEDAAARIGIDAKLLNALVKQRTGPVAYRPTSRINLFRPEDLDAWFSEWTRIEPRECGR